MQAVLFQLTWFWNNLLHTNTLSCIAIFHIGHILSLASTSFIEEEHQTAYFISVTILLIIIFQVLLEEELNKLNFQTNPTGNHYRCAFKGLLLMGLLKIARCWNQTGDKWGHLVIFKFIWFGVLLKPYSKLINWLISLYYSSTKRFCTAYHYLSMNI